MKNNRLSLFIREDVITILKVECSDKKSYKSFCKGNYPKVTEQYISYNIIYM